MQFSGTATDLDILDPFMSKNRIIEVLLIVIIFLIWSLKLWNVVLWTVLCVTLLAGVILLLRFFRDKELLETVTNAQRGTKTERKLVLTLLKQGIPASTIFHDLYVKKPGGNFSQIDVVAVTNGGIIVFEVKNIAGWIFGKGYETHWTKVLAFGKIKHQLYNPILQNESHIRNLKRSLNQFGDIPFYSVIVFYGDCVLKNVSMVPEGTYLVKAKRVQDVVKIVMRKELVPYINRNEIVNVLQQAVRNGDDEQTQYRHIDNINQMLGKDRILE